MPALYIPPEEISVRIRSCATNKCFYSRFSPDPKFNLWDEGPYLDQWWQLIPGTGDKEGAYAIKSKVTGRVIFSKASAPYVGAIDSNGKYDDNWFKLEVGTGKNANYFRLRSFFVDLVIFSNEKVTLGNYAAEPVYDDQYFTFVFEDMEISRIVYTLDQAQILSNTPVVIGSQVNNNLTSHDQTMEFSFSETKTTSYSFDYTEGFTITVGASAKVNIPLVAEFGVKVDVSNSHSLKWGSVSTESKVYAAKFSVTAPPNTKITATATVTRSELEVPFTIYSKSVATGYEVVTKGIYHGVNFWNTRCDYKQEAL